MAEKQRKAGGTHTDGKTDNGKGRQEVGGPLSRRTTDGGRARPAEAVWCMGTIGHRHGGQLGTRAQQARATRFGRARRCWLGTRVDGQ
jgi:hypothetical protein